MSDFDSTKYNSITDCYLETIAPAINAFDYKENQLVVASEGKFYTYNSDEETILVCKSEIDARSCVGERLGCGKIQIKSSLKKSTKISLFKYIVTVELVTDLQKE